jgi:hypothetical protein
MVTKSKSWRIFMKAITIMATLLLISQLSFAKTSEGCNPGKEALEKAALTLAKINNPDGELTAKLIGQIDAETFVVSIDDNYGLSNTTLKTRLSENGFCRIISINE